MFGAGGLVWTPAEPAVLPGFLWQGGRANGCSGSEQNRGWKSAHLLLVIESKGPYKFFL